LRPFSNLPPKVLITLLAVPVILATVLAVWPVETMALLVLCVLITLAGGGYVAYQANADGVACHSNHSSSIGPVTPAVMSFIVAACVLVLLCARGLYFKDGGELAASAHVLGVPHPTGFPLFCLVGKTLDLAPLGNVFFRLNVLSALAMALAAAMAYLSASYADTCSRSEGSSRVAAPILMLVAPASFVASHAVWLHGTTTEVYALSVAGLAATITTFMASMAFGDLRLLMFGWFLTGLGLGGHVTWPLYAVVVGGMATLGPKNRFVGGMSRYGLMAVVATLGAMIVLYLPVAAARDPVMNWGDPSNLSDLWAHLTGERIRQSFTDDIGSLNLATFKARAMMAGGILWRGTGPVWPLAMVGIATGITRTRVSLVTASLSLILALDFLFAVWVNPMGTYDLQTLVSATLAISILAAMGAVRLWRMSDKWLPRGVVAFSAALSVGIQAAGADADRDLTNLAGAREIAMSVFSHAAPGTTVLTSTDDMSAALAALQAVENVRPDMLVLVRQHLSDAPYVRRVLSAHAAFPADDELMTFVSTELIRGTDADPGGPMERLLRLLHARGSVMVEPGEADLDDSIRSRLIPGFPAYMLKDGPVETGRIASGAGMAVNEALAAVSGTDRWGSAFIGAYLRLLATHMVLTGFSGTAAIQVLEHALRLNPGDSRTLQNLGVLVFMTGDRERGLRLLEQSVSIDSAYLRGWQTLAKYAALAGKRKLESRAVGMVEALTR